MKVCHLSMTPVAGAAWAMSESFKEAGYESFCVARSSYDDGRKMPRDEDWPPGPREIAMIRDCDLIFAHQGKPYKMPWYPKTTPTVAIYHSEPRPNHTSRLAEHDGWPWAAIGQWEARLYPGCEMVPNLVPLKHPWYQLGDKPDHTVIVYSPSSKNQRGWNDKGWKQTTPILDEVAKLDGVEVDIITGVPLEECLKRKARAHIVIDEVMTGAYHRSSLEALALGCVVINKIDGLCEDHILRMTGGCGYPFVWSDTLHLRDTLQKLIEHGPGWLASQGQENRDWMEFCWDSASLINRNFKPLMDAAFEHAKEVATWTYPLSPASPVG